MSSDSPAPPPDEELRFDRAVRDTPADTAAGPVVRCTFCSRPIDTQYWHVNGKPVCEDCRRAAESALAPARGTGTWIRAVLFGLGAAIAGAAVYYAVVAITGLEIGIVAILIGYMVGWAVRKAAGGRGSRGLQILAAALTYWSVGLAYAPLAFRGAEGKALGGLLLFTFALPVVAVVGSLPSGLISGAIIFFGIRQAWRMTGVPPVTVSGPYRVGAPSATPA